MLLQSASASAQTQSKSETRNADAFLVPSNDANLGQDYVDTVRTAESGEQLTTAFKARIVKEAKRNEPVFLHVIIGLRKPCDGVSHVEIGTPDGRNRTHRLPSFSARGTGASVILHQVRIAGDQVSEIGTQQFSLHLRACGETVEAVRNAIFVY